MPRLARPAASGGYEIVRLLPVENRSDSPRYRIRSLAEKHERVAVESELTPSKTLEHAGSARERAELALFKPGKR